MGLEWTSIDVLRMEKFLLLVRRVFAAQIGWAKERGFQGEEVDALVRDVLKEWCFLEDGDQRKVPVGIRLHVLDLWVDELEKAGVLELSQADAFVKEIGDLVDLLKSCTIKPVRTRAQESHQDERLPWGAKPDEAEGQDDDGSEDGWGGIED
jgi:ribosomal RNA-processing protein 1